MLTDNSLLTSCARLGLICVHFWCIGVWKVGFKIALSACEVVLVCSLLHVKLELVFHSAVVGCMHVSCVLMLHITALST